jgi:hypothetical protein
VPEAALFGAQDAGNQAGQGIFMATSFEFVISAIRSSGIVAPEIAARALEELRDGVITGEGPSARGRIHFSRSLDAIDADYCAQILLAPSDSTDAPVTRAEADVLLQIDQAASERLDGGRFDDLLVKAIAHHALASAGRNVPPRPVALAPDTPLESWATEAARAGIDQDVRQWIAGHLRRRRRSSKALTTIAAFLIGSGAISAVSTVSTLADFLS